MEYIELRGLSPEMKKKIDNIALNSGETKNRIIKSGLMKIAESYSQEMKFEIKSPVEKKIIRVNGISPKTVRELKAVSENLSIPFESFKKICLIKIIESYPERMQKPPHFLDDY